MSAKPVVTSKSIVLVGTFPPPTTGAAKNNRLFFEDLKNAGGHVRCLNLSGPNTSHHRKSTYHFYRIILNIRAWWSLAIFGGTTAYIVPDGGLGLWYTLAHLWICCVRIEQFVIHHRTYKYIDQKSKIVTWMTPTARQKATHAFLSQIMAGKFQRAYGQTRHLICTNTHYVRGQFERAPVIKTWPTMCLGHLNNLCEEKGFFVVAETFELLFQMGIDVELHLAGPETHMSIPG